MNILAIGAPTVGFKSFRLSRIVTSIIEGLRLLDVTPGTVYRHMHVLPAGSFQQEKYFTSSRITAQRSLHLEAVSLSVDSTILQASMDVAWSRDLRQIAHSL